MSTNQEYRECFLQDKAVSNGQLRKNRNDMDFSSKIQNCCPEKEELLRSGEIKVENSNPVPFNQRASRMLKMIDIRLNIFVRPCEQPIYMVLRPVKPGATRSKGIGCTCSNVDCLGHIKIIERKKSRVYHIQQQSRTKVGKMVSTRIELVTSPV
ncbi:hypothetical protein BC830DRAFT_487376 [Chytriomyces sp. MP71]|nr:hypothetical protein BC830DRAFT_487376 [Chytriomyces sp. MP71]